MDEVKLLEKVNEYLGTDYKSVQFHVGGKCTNISPAITLEDSMTANCGHYVECTEICPDCLRCKDCCNCPDQQVVCEDEATVTYGMKIRWTDTAGNVYESIVSQCETAEEAYESTVKFAKGCGWPGNPKWWQFWRRKDTRIPNRFVSKPGITEGMERKGGLNPAPDSAKPDIKPPAQGV